MDFLAVETLLSDLHPRAERAHCGKLFHCETNSLRCCGEATITERLTRATFAFRHTCVDFRPYLGCREKPANKGGRRSTTPNRAALPRPNGCTHCACGLWSRF